jgi:hypothetical protein
MEISFVLSVVVITGFALLLELARQFQLQPRKVKADN